MFLNSIFDAVLFYFLFASILFSRRFLCRCGWTHFFISAQPNKNPKDTFFFFIFSI